MSYLPQIKYFHLNGVFLLTRPQLKESTVMGVFRSCEVSYINPLGNCLFLIYRRLYTHTGLWPWEINGDIAQLPSCW